MRGSTSRPSENRAEVVKPIRSLDVEVEGLVEVPSGADVFDAFAGRKRCPPAVVEAHHIRCRRGDFAPIMCKEYSGDYGPGARMGARLASKVPRVELGDGGVEVVELEHHECHDPFVSLDLDNDEEFASNRLGVKAPSFNMRKAEAPAPGGNDSRRKACEADIGCRLPVFDLGISPVSDPGVYDATAIV